MKAGSLQYEQFFPVRIDLQGVPCKPYRVWVYSVAIMSLQLVQQQHLIYTTLMRSISTDVDHVMGQLISTRGGEQNSLNEKLNKQRASNTSQHDSFIMIHIRINITLRS